MGDEYDYAMSDFANRVQKWSCRRTAKSWREKGVGDTGTFGDAASALEVPVQQIADAVEFHYWMFTMDDDLPLAQRRIEHEGE
jgi:hypothetical protein